MTTKMDDLVKEETGERGLGNDFSPGIVNDLILEW